MVNGCQSRCVVRLKTSLYNPIPIKRTDYNLKGEESMLTTRQDFIRLAITVIVWYLGLTYLPQITGTCTDGDCGGTAGEILVSVAIPLAFFLVPIALEMTLY